ncbi:phosphagen kinase [Nitratifractor salsuginis]|uniref:Arginine kinase n=1 Tax=Nitratifractor salsuginis (strain DSM 16511 / JCM 12458 / E9I37-1) TaxID=749222 RepID=E6X299_NITSE|nr:phosphagen kinase [Nitratifractor salsuginis]ADV46034.1 Arginine kinase [Nitratifractor salsuginis DSM 16511]
MTNDYPRFPNDCKSLLCKYLTPELFETLKDKKTRYGFTLRQAINSGVINPDSSIGVYAGDEESYELFAPLFDPIIEEYHGFTKGQKHLSDMNPEHLKAPNPDPEGNYILSTRIRVGRNLHCFPLGPNIARRERLIAECMISDALKALEGDLAGEYYPLLGMSKEVQQQLIEDHFLFKEGDRFLEAAGLNRDWPEGRGIYHNRDKTFLVWVNEEDQLRIISMQPGGDIEAVFARLSRAVAALEKQLTFAFDEHLGYITSCPTNLGTAMRASVHIRLPKLARDMERFKAITDRHHLQIRGIHGEHSESEGGIYDISNRRRLGITEVEAVQEMHDGVVELIEAEASL